MAITNASRATQRGEEQDPSLVAIHAIRLLSGLLSHSARCGVMWRLDAPQPVTGTRHHGMLPRKRADFSNGLIPNDSFASTGPAMARGGESHEEGDTAMLGGLRIDKREC